MNSSRTVIQEDKIVVDPLRKSSASSTTARNQATTPGNQEQADTRPVLLYVIIRTDWEDEEKHLYMLCEYFAPDYQVHVVCGAYEYRGTSILQNKLRKLDTTLHPLASLVDKVVLVRECKAAWQLLRLIYQLDPEVIHSYNAKTTALAGLARWIIRHRARLVGSIYQLADTQEALGFTARLARWVRTRAYDFADALIVVDEYLRTQAQAQFVKPERIHLIRPGLMELDFIDPERKRRALAEDAPGTLGSKIRDSQTILVGNIAPLEPEHNPGYILQALASLAQDNYQFVYIHYGEGSQRSLLEHEIEQFNLHDHVLLKGYDSNAHQYLNLFDIILHPSSTPGVSDLVQSAGLAQRALVLSPTPGLENAVADEKEVAFVEARNAQALADKLAYLIEHPERRRSMGKALEMRVRADYQIEEMHHRTRTLYGVE